MEHRSASSATYKRICAGMQQIIAIDWDETMHVRLCAELDAVHTKLRELTKRLDALEKGQTDAPTVARVAAAAADSVPN